jgi:putative transposase
VPIWYNQVMNKRTPYETDLTEAQWQLLEPLLPPAAREGRPIEIERREIVNAIFYKLKTGCHWRLLPHDLPKWQTVYYYFRKWRADGTLVLLHDQLRTQLRIQMGREPQPQIASIDSQSVKTTEKGGYMATTVVRR